MFAGFINGSCIFMFSAVYSQRLINKEQLQVIHQPFYFCDI